LNIYDSSSFLTCISTSTGGAIYGIISGGEVELNKITFRGCKGFSGGAVYSTISGDGKLTINN
jgi:hypothetical protein